MYFLIYEEEEGNYMPQWTYDICYEDLNPTVLFASKTILTQTGERHSHDYTEVFIIMNGKQQFYLNGETYEVSTGDIIICNPGDIHQEVALLTPEVHEFVVGFTDYQFKDMPSNHIVWPDKTKVIHTNSKVGQSLLSLCNDMIEEGYSGQAGRYFMQKAYLLQILIWIMREKVEMANEQNRYSFENYSKTYAVKKIRKYLENHYNEKISLDLIAKNMYLSSVYISKIFKEETGETPINYLIKLRLEKSKEYLEKERGESIREIAEKVGYDDAYHFSKLFKKYYGVAPAYYKKCIRERKGQ